MCCFFFFSSLALFFAAGDVLKIDFGTHVSGHIVDCAWTYAYDTERFGPLLDAVRAATETGIREAGIDARLAEIGEAIQETMEAHEITLDGVVYPIKVPTAHRKRLFCSLFFP
jgi:methionyl aminopeptidase